MTNDTIYTMRVANLGNPFVEVEQTASQDTYSLKFAHLGNPFVANRGYSTGTSWFPSMLL